MSGAVLLDLLFALAEGEPAGSTRQHKKMIIITNKNEVKDGLHS